MATSYTGSVCLLHCALHSVTNVLHHMQHTQCSRHSSSLTGCWSHSHSLNRRVQLITAAMMDCGTHSTPSIDSLSFYLIQQQGLQCCQGCHSSASQAEFQQCLSALTDCVIMRPLLGLQAAVTIGCWCRLPAALPAQQNQLFPAAP